MRWLKNNEEQGFTLLEIMVVIAILGVVIFLSHDLFTNAIQSLTQGKKQAKVQGEVSRAAEVINKKLKYATDINILDSPPTNLNKQLKQHSYIFVDEKENKIIHYAQNKVGFIRQAKQIISHPVSYHKSGYYNYQLHFRRKGNKNKVLSFSLGVKQKDIDCGSTIYTANLPEQIDGACGSVVEFTPIESELERIYRELDWNRFWREFVWGSKNDTLQTGEGDAQFKETPDGEEQAVRIKGTGDSHGGQSFMPLKGKHFGSKANINSFSVTVDAKINKDISGGYGVLLRGVCLPIENDKNSVYDFGYMFQFDPGANGFLMRRIKNGDHENVKYIGGQIKEDNFDSWDPEAEGLYTPAEIKTDDVPWSLATRNSDWKQRYKTKIKVQTQPNGELIIRARLIDDDGDKSNELWFGDFGKIILNGTQVKGGNRDSEGNFKSDKGLDWGFFTDEDNDVTKTDFPGKYLALRSWTNDDDGDYAMKFYEISIGGAEPGVKNIEVVDYQLVLTFDEELNLSEGEKVTKDLFAFKNTSKEVSIKRITAEKTNLTLQPIKLKITCDKKIEGLEGTLIYNPALSKNKKTALEDDQGNQVNQFKLDIKQEALVQNGGKS